MKLESYLNYVESGNETKTEKNVSFKMELFSFLVLSFYATVAEKVY